MTPRRRLLAAAASPLLALALAAPVGAAPSPQHRVVVPGTHPAWAQASADLGPVGANAPVTVRIYLAGQDEAELTAFAQAVSDPHSTHYRHFLTPQQVRERFGPSPEQTASVHRWLSSAGLTISRQTDHYLVAEGTAEQAQRAFAVQLHSFRREAHTYQAPVGEASVPAEVASAVLAVHGLNTAPHQVHHGSGANRPAAARSVPQDTLPGPAPAFVNSGPFSSYYGEKPATGTPEAYGQVQPYVIQGYDGARLRSAYGASATGLTGQGVTVAIVDAYDSPTLDQDTATYAAAHGDAPYAPGQLMHDDPAEWTHTQAPTDADPTGCGAQGWYGEQTLDVEAVHAVAPEAGIQYVGAASCQDPDMIDALRRVVDGHLADIVSNSWGEAENASDPALDPVYQQIFHCGAAEGIGFYFSSGDDGDDLASTGTKQTDMPASLDSVTAVGGTALGLDQDGAYSFETGWGTLKAPLSSDGTSWTNFPGAFTSGAGGGTSGRVKQPSYQRKVVPRSLSGANGGRNRVVPDIAAVADPNTGFLVGQTQTFPNGEARYSEYRIGGTSLAAPVISGLQALAQQASGKPIGFANPAIYQRYGSSAFHDVTDQPFGPDHDLAEVRVDFVNGVDASQGTVTSLRSLGKDSSLHAVEGYDDVTGVGTPTADYLTSYAEAPKH
ncbi:serine protease [Kitasatospora sp. MMS16-BH015]|uniref:S53 family peptidase n=1 Tax=Kitasatospora sp. MMS16-BH015 TaxID=2018025 RepID=UPI000CA2727B|nr:S53 family peptidase [Kitasatospora sp. MMS16-BH015]AUG76387.1 serine protease [Kitasatospora sp. MMS16-BH015]